MPGDAFMLKIMKPDEENDELFIVEDERGVKRKVFYQDDDVFIFAGGPLENSYHDDLNEFDGILPELDRTLEDCQIAVERLKGERARALQEDHLALYLALETKVAQLSGYVQGLTFARERLGNDQPGEILVEGDVRVNLDDSIEAQAKLDGIVRRIETLLARRAQQENLN
jgi:hypothetical protein